MASTRRLTPLKYRTFNKNPESLMANSKSLISNIKIPDNLTNIIQQQVRELMGEVIQQNEISMAKLKAEINTNILQVQTDLEAKLGIMLVNYKKESSQEWELKSKLEIQALKEKTARQLTELEETMQKNFQKQENIINKMSKDMQLTQAEAQKVEIILQKERRGKLQLTEEQEDMNELLQKQKCLRLRGIPESMTKTREDLFTVVSDTLALALQWDPEEMEGEIDNLFRNNSKIAREKQLPRDITVYFTRLIVRDKIFHHCQQNGLKIGDHQIKVFREIPARILAKRAEYRFLTRALHQMDVRFRWEFPRGLTVFWNDQKFRLTSIRQAEAFYNKQIDLKS